ncbi:MAG TPA: DEAD/DEAH box helicase family protein [Chitinophagales bacterium]|nr:DEAD/DEAH box helicase family protein [Chitinophagales bacterium]HQW77877.1 DEAD/DEAH box helicase family protein [Chitinophagales bacterium]HRB66425.1 DEAD/DEAH box helicase family protein [Chitinophagales bacterium]
MGFLYETLNAVSGFVPIDKTRFSLIDDNLNSKFPIREYQIKSFSRFDYYMNNNFEGKPNKPTHLLYNMATGSGKTLVMAGLMLYLYEKGFRNFLFFVHTNNILEKTKDNFLNKKSIKYLFADRIVINSKEVLIKQVNNFDEADNRNINIHFTSIQKLHSDLVQNEKENALSVEDFKDKKIVLLGDEAHHYNANSKSQLELFKSWEKLIDDLHKSSFDNILLEFTATHDYNDKELNKKYQDKVIFKYDLAQFRIDKYSKEINLIRSGFDQQERIIQALILNLYRQELATTNNINLKPVILFKAKKTIKESEQNKVDFHHLVDLMSAQMVDQIRNTATVSIVQKAFNFFDSINISSAEISRRIKSNFRFENCISANNDEEAEKNQLLLNTLEDEKNPIRAVFAVQKLNEGWDVLNLFDIVRLYEGQNTGGSNTKIGATTLSEAQLIGRGARYFPFALEEGQDKYTRKHDDDQGNDLKILEELYYHTKEDSRYISELKKALVESGIYEDEDKLETKQLTLKLDFKDTDFYKTGKVVYNKKVEKSYNNIKSFADLGVSKRNFAFTLSSGSGRISSAFSKEEETTTEKTESKDIKVAAIPKHIIRFVLAQNPYFYFDSLERFFPNVGSLSNFIESTDYLGGLEITFNGLTTRLAGITNNDYLLAIQGLLQNIEMEIKSNLTEFEGSGYIKEYVHKVFKDKEIKVYKDSERANGQEALVANEPWYVYNANYGTSEEKKFVELFQRRFEGLKEKFTNIYLIRNEREIKIIDKLGRAFEPDFVLFCKQKKGKELTYQVFIEPKGAHLIANDKWKEEFLKQIREEEKTIKIDTDNYVITGVPFYNYASENEFKKTLEDTLKI